MIQTVYYFLALLAGLTLLALLETLTARARAGRRLVRKLEENKKKLPAPRERYSRRGYRP